MQGGRIEETVTFYTNKRHHLSHPKRFMSTFWILVSKELYWIIVPWRETQVLASMESAVSTQWEGWGGEDAPSAGAWDFISRLLFVLVVVVLARFLFFSAALSCS